MEEKIDQILNDIYMADKSLREHDQELRQMIEKVIKSRPKAELDDNFVQELRQELMEKARELKAEPAPSKAFVFTFPKFAYALGGAALVLVVMIPFLTGRDEGGRVVFNKGIQQAGSRAFGELSSAGIYESEAQSPEGLGAGGGGQMTQSKEMDGSPSSGTDSARIMPRRVNYEFVYSGDEFTLPEGDLKVYKRVKNEAGAKDLAGQLTSVNTDLMDLDNLENTAVRNLDLVEDKEFGHALNFNLQENVISINKYYEKWPNPFKQCQGDSDCYERNRLKPSDVPSNKRITSLAADFLSSYGINMSYYGRGEVQDSWRRSYELSKDKDNVYIPDEISVVYPLILDSRTVYSQSGDKNGLSVNVDIRSNRVAGANPIMAYNFQSSAYPAVDDKEKLMQLLKDGGTQPYYEHEDPTETVTVELGTPELALFKYFARNSGDNTAQELFVPGYIFPVENVSDESSYFFRKAIVVPAVKDLVEIEKHGDRPGIPEPMPRADELEADDREEESQLPPTPDSGSGAGQSEPGSPGQDGIGIQIEE